MLSSPILTPSRTSTLILVFSPSSLECLPLIRTNPINTITRRNTYLSPFSNSNLSVTIPIITTNNRKTDFTLKSDRSWLNFNVKLRADWPNQNKLELYVWISFVKLHETPSLNWVCRSMCTEVWLPNSQLTHPTWTSRFTVFNRK